MRALKTRHRIPYRGLMLEVEGYFCEGTPQTYEHPAEPSEFEIHEVWVGDTDISSLFDDYTELERKTLEKHYS